MTDTSALHSRFGIPGVVDVAPAAGGLPAVAITTPQAEALVYLHGAHITHFQPLDQQPILFVSDKSLFQPGKAIRGGIPVIFPWFGPNKTDPKLPSHGFARTMPWTLAYTAQHKDGSVSVTLDLADDEAARKLWPHPFELEYRITVSDSLRLELQVRNPGPDSFNFEEALHSYFAVEDSRQITIQGLANREYLDKTQDMKRFRQTDPEVKITAETDRHYLATQDPVIIHDPAAKRNILIEKERSEVTVVWNPWIEKSKTFADLGEEEWQKFVCVETANAYDYAVELPAGATHTMTARISLG
jgi:D-hexose-6-phosphate mutarotase